MWERESVGESECGRERELVWEREWVGVGERVGWCGRESVGYRERGIERGESGCGREFECGRESVWESECGRERERVSVGERASVCGRE